MSRNKMTVVNKLVVYGCLFLLLMFVSFPFIWMFITSFKPNDEILTGGLRILPTKFTFQHYRDVFEYGNLGTYFRNSVVVAASTVSLSFLAVIPGAYATSKLRLRGSHIISRSVLIFQMMPGVLLLIPLYILLRQFNLINTHWALILSYSTFTIPFCFLLAKSYFNGLPDELFEAAFVDGCTSWQAFIKVGIPMAAPGLMVTSVYAFLLAWNDFMFANTFVNSDHLRTLPSGIVNMQTSWGVQWGQMTAASTVTVLPVFLVFMIANKYIIEGLTAGAVKG